MDYARVVHADQKFDYNRPIFAGDVLTVRMRIADIRQKMGSDFVTFETQVLDQSQQLLATTTSLLIVRGTDGAA
jgi:acyl-CoA thioesterase FadM